MQGGERRTVGTLRYTRALRDHRWLHVPKRMELASGPAPRRLVPQRPKASPKPTPRKAVEDKHHVTIAAPPPRPERKHVTIDVPADMEQAVVATKQDDDSFKAAVHNLQTRDSKVQVHDDTGRGEGREGGLYLRAVRLLPEYLGHLGRGRRGRRRADRRPAAAAAVTYYYYYHFETDAHADHPDFVREPQDVDLLDRLASGHPILYLATDLGGLLVISVLVLFEADLHRMYRDYKARMKGFQPLHEQPGSPDGAHGGSKPLKMMRDRTLKRELHRAIDASEELQLRLMVKKMTPIAPSDKGVASGNTTGGGAAGAAGAGAAGAGAAGHLVWQGRSGYKRRWRGRAAGRVTTSTRRTPPSLSSRTTSSDGPSCKRRSRATTRPRPSSPAWTATGVAAGGRRRRAASWAAWRGCSTRRWQRSSAARSTG